MRIRIAPRADGIPADRGDPLIPSSKSHAQRALCLSELLSIGSEFEDLRGSGDVSALSTALRRVKEESREGVDWGGESIRLEDNGTALRILSVLVPMIGAQAVIDAGPRLRSRPLGAAEEFLGRYGAVVSDGWPRRFDGRGVDWPAELVVDASLTTQVATGVLLGAAIRTARNMPKTHHVIRITSPAAPDYLLVTLETLSWFGFGTPAWWDDEDFLVEIQSWRRPDAPHRVTVPPDASSYTFFNAFLAMHGLETSPPEQIDPHPDWLVVDDISRLLAAAPNESLTFSEIGSRPDTFPCLAVLAALRCGKTIFRGAPALRHKESDRIHAMAVALDALGVRCEELPDGLTIEGPMAAHDHAIEVPTPGDHRVVMAMALLGTRIPGGVELHNPRCVEKSWPTYFDWLERVSELTWLE